MITAGRPLKAAAYAWRGFQKIEWLESVVVKDVDAGRKIFAVKAFVKPQRRENNNKVQLNKWNEKQKERAGVLASLHVGQKVHIVCPYYDVSGLALFSIFSDDAEKIISSSAC
ncbi:hypothetical protein Tco_1111816 [Tanacetum coccineum]|uniref:Uncharacterized protein n=1 Tax=Tanacetum coccineum TaxID=301880 RepID=A0ABQ5IMS3_9ASTR